MPPGSQVRAFTTFYSGLANALVNEVGVAQTYHAGPPPKFQAFKAIWDTGATHTVITRRVAVVCGLGATGVSEVQHAQGTALVSTYIVNIRLQNMVEAASVKVWEGDLGGDADVLIGMDIIGMGDFAVTNFMGKTAFSFRFPSAECIDFVNQPPADPSRRPPKLPPVPPPKSPAAYPGASRNAPCPCGSGKKYKKCHGANA